MKKKHVLLFALCAQASLMYSQERKDTLRNIELPAAVIKSNKEILLNEKSKLKITSATIKKQNSAQDLPYLLNRMSSVVLTSDAGAGTGYTGIRIRGADLTRINVTMNGVPVNDAESQATYFVNTPDLLSSTKEIEVNKGVGNSKNGVGSFGAGIAINNLDVDYVKPAFLFQTDYGSFNTIKTVVKASTGLIQDKFVSTIRLSTIKSDGYIQRSNSDLKGLQWTSKYLFNKSTQLVLNYLNGKEKTGQAWNGVPQDSLQYNRTFNELGLKSDGTFYDNQTDNYGQQYYQLFFDKKLNANLSFGSTLFYTKGKGYYEEYKTSQDFSDYYLNDFMQGNDTITSTDLIRQLWLDNDFYGGRIYTNYLSKKLDAGLYFNINQYDGKHFGEVIWAQYNIDHRYKWYDVKARKNDVNLYGMLDYRFHENFSLFGDMQVRNVDYRINGFRRNPNVKHHLNYLFFNPKMKLTYQNKKHIASLLLGIAQKEPNREDFETVASFPKPEKLYNLELNYVALLHKTVSLHATIFLMEYSNQLVLTGKLNDVGSYTRSNVDNSFRRGIEIEAFWKPAFKMIELQANIALSQNKIRRFNEFIDNYDNGTQIMNTYLNTDISFSPSVISSMQMNVLPFIKNSSSKFQNVSINLLEKFVGDQYLDNTSNRNRMLKAYLTTDLLCNVPVKLKQHNYLNIRTGLYNVFNTTYEANGYTYSYQFLQVMTTQNYYYPQAKRSFMLGVGIEL